MIPVRIFSYSPSYRLVVHVRGVAKCTNLCRGASFSSHATGKIFRPSGRWIGIGTVLTTGCVWTTIPGNIRSNSSRAQCDVAVTTDAGDDDFLTTRHTTKKSTWTKVKRATRLVRRVLKLFFTLSPIVALYPLHYLQIMVYPLPTTDEETETDDAHKKALACLTNSNGNIGWYYRLCLYCVECSGAAAIKMMQWAGSRPDMFGSTFCRVFSQLQDDTTPHAWAHTVQSLVSAYGDNWHESLQLSNILGSGCIAQVYKGKIEHNGNERLVAIKVKHPNVDDDIDSDLDIMRLSVYILERIPFDAFRNLRWLNLPGFVEEMATMLSIQLDLRREAEHLNRFNNNFKNNDVILFPKLVEGYEPTREVLVETYCEGQPINEFVRKNTMNKSTLRNMCKSAVRAVCQMIFIDNFIHGDLHPGNVLVNDENKFVLLDVGIVVENSRKDHRLISDVLAAFIRQDGRKAGLRMMDDSNSRLQAEGVYALEEECFLEKMEDITIKASAENYFMEHLGVYITRICNAAVEHRVILNQAFISAALAVKVQEGIALALDPSIQIWKVATPIILEGERRHGYMADHAREIFNFDVLINWLRDKTLQTTSKAESSKSDTNDPVNATALST